MSVGIDAQIEILENNKVQERIWVEVYLGKSDAPLLHECKNTPLGEDERQPEDIGIVFEYHHGLSDLLEFAKLKEIKIGEEDWGSNLFNIVVPQMIEYSEKYGVENIRLHSSLCY